MHHELLREVSSGWICDNGMAVMTARAGESVDPGELFELASNAKTMFNLSVLVCRQEHRITDCRELWADAHQTFCAAVSAWSDIPASQDSLLRFYLMQLHRLRELSAARVNLYSVY